MSSVETSYEDAQQTARAWWRMRGLQSSTIEAYERVESDYFTWARAHGFEALPVNVTAVTQYIADRAERLLPTGGHYQPTSVDQSRNALRSFYGALHRAGAIPVNVTVALVGVRRAEGTPSVPLTRLQARKLLNGASLSQPCLKARNVLVARQLLYTGARRGEVCTLIWEDVQVDRRAIRYRAAVTKSHRARLVPIGRGLRELFDEFYSLSGTPSLEAPVYRSRRGGALGRQGVEDIVKSAAVAGDVGRHVTPHALRYTFATRLRDHGVQLEHVSRLLGHHSIAETQRYLHWYVNDVRRAAPILDTLYDYDEEPLEQTQRPSRRHILKFRLSSGRRVHARRPARP